MPVYEYEGKHYDLPDGLTNEQAKAKIEGHLGKTPTSPEPVETPEQSSGVGKDLLRGAGLAVRAVNTGLSAVPNAVMDAGAGSFNIVSSLFGSDKRLPYMSHLQQQGMDNIGVPRPEGFAEKALSGGVSALSGGLGMNGLVQPALVEAQAAARAFPNIAGNTQRAQEVGRLMTTTAPQAASLAAGGAVAPSTFETIKDITGSDIAATVGTMGISTLVGGGAGKLADKKAPLLTMDQVRERAQRNYAVLDQSGVTLKPNWVRAAINGVERTLRGERYDPQLHPEVRRTLEVLRDTIDTNPGAIPVSKLDEMRKRALDLKASTDKNTQRLGGELVDELDNFFNNLPAAALQGGSRADAQAVAQAVTAARKDWRNLSRAETIEEIMRRADVKSDRVSAAQSEQIRQELISLQANQRKMRLFSEEEREAIRAMTKDGMGKKIASQIATFSPTRRGLAATGSLTGAAAAAGAGQQGVSYTLAALMAAGWTADKALGFVRQNQGTRLIQEIANGSVKAPPPPEFGRAAAGGMFAQPLGYGQ